MKSTTLLPGIFVSLVTAQGPDAPIQTGPFYLQIQSNDSTVDGRYLASCHTGAAMQTLCLGDSTKPGGTNAYSSLYFFNQTVDRPDSQQDLGYITWNLPLSTGGDVYQNVSLPLSLVFNNVGSNVVPTSISVGTSNPQLVGFHNDVLYIPNWIDDSTFVEGVYPNITGEVQQLSQWHACSTLFGSYYYQALAWVTSGAPHNKNCRPVDVVKVAYP